jgi:hypothetical protein
VYAILLQSEPFLQRIRHLYGITKSRKTVPALIGAAIAGVALIILMLLKMGISNQAGDEQAGTVKEATPSLTQVPDWTIFDEIFANEPIRLATSEFVDGVRTSAAALIPDTAAVLAGACGQAASHPRIGGTGVPSPGLSEQASN